MSAVDSDRWDCVLAVPLDGETAQALCERLARTFTKGCCYYQLLKKESISATKGLALKKPSGAWLVGSAEVRAELGLAPGAIKVAPADLHDGAVLFVQSTSSNRKLSAEGGALLVRPKGTDTVADDPAAGAAAHLPPAKRAKPTVGAAGAAASAAMPRASLDWDALPRVAWECVGVIMAPGAPAPPGYCDQEATDAERFEEAGLAKLGFSLVTRASLDAFLAPLKDANNNLSQRLAQNFVADETAVLSNGLGNGAATVHRWNGETGDRLEVWLSTVGDTAGDGMIALEEVQNGRVLVVGCACGHPYLLCNEFTFGNSDGSSGWTPPDAPTLVAGAAGVAQVIDLLCTLAHATLFEQVH